MSLDDDDDGERRRIRSASGRGGERTSGSGEGDRDARAAPLTYENAVLERGRANGDSAGVLTSPGSTMQMLGTAEAATRAGQKPLKINQDLALYRARKLRNEAGYLKSKEERTAMRYQAIAMFEKAMSYDVTDGRAYCGIGQILVQMRLYDEARQIYQAGCDAKGGDNAYLWTAFAVLEEKCGNIKLARKYYDAATAADEKHAAAWHGWGTLERNLGNYQRARELYMKGIRKVPLTDASAHLYHSLGVMAMERGRISEAREFFRQGVRTEAGSKSGAIWQSWAILEGRSGDEDQARKLFQKGLAADPKSKYIWLAWGTWEAKIGYVDRAKELLTKGCKLNPLDTYLLQALAKLEAEQGSIVTARKYFEQGTVMDPRHQANWNAWALAEWRAGEIEKARNLFQRGVWVDPKNKNAARLFHAWGVLECRERNISLARQLFKCAVNVDAGSERIWLTWAMMEEQEGDDIRAIEIRNLAAQRVAEASMSTTDLAPAAGTFRPLFERLASIVGLEAPRDSTDDNEFDASELTEAELMYGEKDAVKSGQPLMERDIE
ncbi:Tetratricopeptide repeat [Ostreococcus tauri]|uniref:Tetratricopeptide repeat n=1 Tax=Ostreococcus tauri TaxID=70448 RepID=A0A090M583_OSTTA|nr:Tetratricopeptide repeat [Ostreococcus tauri]CEF97837.1 Tetratricopeptide repeat [Ostreococcus tauri]|eukprot:XP_022838915.1 Tetratricopeptide repeat [Ostreococcus tauri]